MLTASARTARTNTLLQAMRTHAVESRAFWSRAWPIDTRPPRRIVAPVPRSMRMI